MRMAPTFTTALWPIFAVSSKWKGVSPGQGARSSAKVREMSQIFISFGCRRGVEFRNNFARRQLTGPALAEPIDDRVELADHFIPPGSILDQRRNRCNDRIGSGPVLNELGQDLFSSKQVRHSQ